MRFEEVVLPRCFKESIYSSFRCQLNQWGFKRLVQMSCPNHTRLWYLYHEFLFLLRSKAFLYRPFLGIGNVV